MVAVTQPDAAEGVFRLRTSHVDAERNFQGHILGREGTDERGTGCYAGWHDRSELVD